MKEPSGGVRGVEGGRPGAAATVRELAALQNRRQPVNWGSG